MKDKGTPDLSVTGDMPLSASFEKNGQQTYAVYNPTDSDKTVTFSDGTSFTAVAGQLTEHFAEKPTTTGPPTTTPDPSAPTTTVKPTPGPEEGYIRLSDDLYYKKIQYDVVGMNNPELLDAGTTLQFAFAPTRNVKVYVDGEDTPAGQGPINLISNVIVKMNPTKLEDDSYTNIKIVADSGTSEVILRKGSPVPPTEATTEAPSTKEPTTVAPTTEAPTQTPTVEPTTAEPTTYNPRPPQTETVAPTSLPKPIPAIRVPDKAKVKKAIKKKKSAKKIKVKLKKLKGVKGYQVAVYKTKKKAKKNKKALVKKYVKKVKFTLKSKKFKKKKKLYIRARGFVYDGSAKVFGKWSKVKKVKIKK
jgi:hypothetical protein